MTIERQMPMRALPVPGIALLIWASTVTCAAGDWPEPACDGRVRLTVTGDMHTRAGGQVEAILDFNEVLGFERTLAAGSLVLRDPETELTIPLDLAQDPELRYPSRNPLLRLRWQGGAFGRFDEKTWDLYFRTVEPNAAGAWKTIGQAFSARYPSTVLLATSFEVEMEDITAKADPASISRPLPMRTAAPEHKTASVSGNAAYCSAVIHLGGWLGLSHSTI